MYWYIYIYIYWLVISILYLRLIQPETLPRSATVRRVRNVLRPLRPSPIYPQRGAVGWAQGRPFYHPSTTPSKGNFLPQIGGQTTLAVFLLRESIRTVEEMCECRIYEFLQKRLFKNMHLLLSHSWTMLAKGEQNILCFYNGVMCSIPHQGNILLAAFSSPFFLLDLHSSCSFFKYLNTWTCNLTKDGFARNQCLNICSSP